MAHKLYHHLAAQRRGGLYKWTSGRTNGWLADPRPAPQIEGERRKLPEGYEFLAYRPQARKRRLIELSNEYGSCYYEAPCDFDASAISTWQDLRPYVLGKPKTSYSRDRDVVVGRFTEQQFRS